MVVERRRKVVFVVDDDAGFRKSIALLLSKYGFSPELYPSAEAFLATAKLTRRRESCIILDIQLDGMSGIELGKKLALDGRALPIIYITGNDNDAARKAALQQGCIAYLTKPCAAKTLMNAIDQALAWRDKL
jgi:FixJ family two-component response regulator